MDENPPGAPVQIPFRTGATSYVIADDLLPNARYLAGKVDDMELVLFDLNRRIRITLEASK